MSNPGAEQLQALITYANEVTGASDTKISDAVATLASGYGQGGFNPFPYLYNGQNLFQNQALPETVTLDFEGNSVISNMQNMFRNTTGCKNIVIKNLTVNCTLSQLIMFSSVETLTFENCTIKPTSVSNFADSARQITAIYGEIDMTNCINASVFFKNAWALHTVRFKENSISASLSNNFCPNPAAFTTETWVSIANALDPTAGQTITIGSSNQTAITAILGTNDNGTFVQDANGTMTLTDFITNIKGWTIS